MSQLSKIVNKRKLTKAVEIILSAEHRAMCCDGPVGPTIQEMTQSEVYEVSKLLGIETLTEQVLRQAYQQSLQ